MKISIFDFEQHIDETILKRGLDYYKKGAILQFSEISNNEFEAIIAGTEEYTVHLHIKNNGIIEHTCDCPFDMGTVCKHVVAVIFHLQQDALDINQSLPKSPRKRKTISINKQIKELLKVISHAELIEFVDANTKKDKKFANYFLASFGHLIKHQSKEFYQKQIHAILRTAASRDGWIDWKDMKYVVNALQPFIQNAEKQVENQDFENVYLFSIALLEEMEKAFQYADDSNGDLGYFVNSAIDLLVKVAIETTSKTLKKQLFQYCITAFKQRFFEGWDWHLGILFIANDLIENEQEAAVVLDCLASVKGEYDREFAQLFTLKILRKYKHPAEVEKFINDHISNPKIREEEIENAFENKNFDKAIALAKDGIQCDEKSKPGLAKVWHDWLLKIALALNDTPNIIQYARYRLINNFRSTHDYYQILKNTIEPTQWHSFLEEIIEEITPKQRWSHAELIREIYIKEEWWDRLFLMLKQNVSLENIEQNESYLAKDYANELIELYHQRILIYLENFIGRNYYKTACRYLHNMRKLGGNDKATELIHLLRKKYPQRKALLDELNKL